MKKKILKATFVAIVGLIAGINLYNAQKTEVLSDVAMANVEALANTEQPNIKDCIEASSDCIALHPTDESLDQHKPNARWPTTDYKF
jgi:hypothetical protein